MRGNEREVREMREMRELRGRGDSARAHVFGRLTDAPCCAGRGYLWSYPEDADDTTGLGGGITWQWDPRLCEVIIDKFDEDFFFIPFIQCSDLKASMHRAFDS